MSSPVYDSAIARVAADGTQSAGNNGFAAGNVKTTTGTYILTLEDPADATECIENVSLQGTTAGLITCEKTSDTQITVKTFNTSFAATDFPFCVKVTRKGDGP